MINESEAYKQGIRDCQKKRYPLYGVLVAAEQYYLANSYAKGWQTVSGTDLATWTDKAV